MTSLHSNDEFFQGVEDLIAKLKDGGHQQAAVDLRDGLAHLNGLTDGWACFLESIERVQATESKRFAREHQRALEMIRATAHAAVFRR